MVMVNSRSMSDLNPKVAAMCSEFINRCKEKNIDPPNVQTQWGKAKTFSPENPIGKSSNVKVLKIQLGLSCNYTCDYCSQRFVERPAETSKKDIESFINQLDNLRMDYCDDGGLAPY